MNLKKIFETYEILNMSPDEIKTSRAGYHAYEEAVKILRWKIEAEQNPAKVERYKNQLRACLKKAMHDYYPWEAMCYELARDIASGEIQQKKFRNLMEVMRYYRGRAYRRYPRLWKSSYEKIYHGIEPNHESF
jgi:hypothetical protein